MIVFGGDDDPMKVSRFSNLASLDSLRRSELKPAGKGRQCFSVALHYQYAKPSVIFIVSGSLLETEELTPMVTAYNLESETYTDIVPLQTARSLHISCVVGSYLCVVGGLSSDWD